MFWHTSPYSFSIYSGDDVNVMISPKVKTLPKNIKLSQKYNTTCLSISENWQRFVSVGEVLLAGYFFHYVPFFFYDRTLFLHHYLPAYMYKIMLTAYVVSHLEELCASKYVKILLYLTLVMWSMMVLKVFIQYSPLSIGQLPLSAEEVKNLRWKDTWDFIIHKP